MKVSIVHICKVYLPVHGGIQTVIKRITDGLSSVLDTTVVSCSRDQAGEFRIGNLELINAKSYGEWLSLPVAPGVVPKFRRAVRASTLMCIHYPFPLAELALLFLNTDKKGLIVYWHSEIVAQKYARYLIRPLTHFMLKRADRIIVSSPALLEHSTLLRRYRSKCEVIPFGYNPPHDIKSPTEEGNYYVCVGRHISYKGIETLIRAWPGMDCKLVLIGNGQLLNRHKALSDQLDNGDKIEFIDYADDASVTRHIASCRALILPSVAPNEAFGLVQVEAMSLGKPIINTRLESGVPWVARDGIEAITVTPGSAREIHVAVNRMESDEGLRQRLGEGARLRWQQEFGIDQFTQRTADLYRSVLTEKQVSHPLADTPTPPFASDQPVKH